MRVANNLVAFHAAKGMYVQNGTASHSAPNNLVYGNGWNDWTPGPTTLTVDPLLEDPAYPRPVNASPALDAGNNAKASSLLFDANGERRLAFGPSMLVPWRPMATAPHNSRHGQQYVVQ